MKGNFEKSCIIGSKEFYDKTLHVRNCNMIFCKKTLLILPGKIKIFASNIYYGNKFIILTNFTFLLFGSPLFLQETIVVDMSKQLLIVLS